MNDRTTTRVPVVGNHEQEAGGKRGRSTLDRGAARSDRVDTPVVTLLAPDAVAL